MEYKFVTEKNTTTLLILDARFSSRKAQLYFKTFDVGEYRGVMPAESVQQLYKAIRQLSKITSVMVSPTGTVEVNGTTFQAYNARIIINGTVSYRYSQLELHCIIKGVYAKIGSLLYPLDVRVKEYRAVLTSGDTCISMVLDTPLYTTSKISPAR
ncbi:hypothetical protein [Hyperthermus butylicus]|nr:hypothetical protein [Hyperthermus butylicus]